ncbi:MAG: preprotein translocase subunit SecG [Candidatus Omnitrophica bacterium]|nr:preprotein translocase subunit SecG [Candidatus Omnitrophota bacterium]
MYALLIVIHVIVSIVLILVILLQAGRGGGLSESFGMSSTQTVFGTSAAKFLKTATSVCAIVFLLTCLGLAALSTGKSRSLMETQRARKILEDLSKEEKKDVKEAVDKTGQPQEKREEQVPVKAEEAKQEAPKTEPQQ